MTETFSFGVKVVLDSRGVVGVVSGGKKTGGWEFGVAEPSVEVYEFNGRNGVRRRSGTF